MHTQDFPQLASVEQIEQGFESHGYICSRKIATAVFLAFQLRKPVLVEGPPGVGKTELAKTTALLLDLPLIRLQCYEGLDEAKALYEWKYGKQLLDTQVLKEKRGDLLQGVRCGAIHGRQCPGFLRGVPLAGIDVDNNRALAAHGLEKS